MKSRLFVVLLVLCHAGLACAKPTVQNVLPLTTVPAGASVAYTGGAVPWGNPASAAGDTAVVLQIGYENKYFSPLLSDEYISILIPTPYFNISASYNFFGLAAYHEMMAAFSVSRKWGRVALGIEADYFNYYDAHQERYHHAFTAQVGVAVDITKSLTLAFRAFNPTFSLIKLYDTPRHLPVLFQLGASYRFYHNIDLLAQVGYEYGSGIHWAIGLEYDIERLIVAKVGVRGAAYAIPMIGAGVKFGKFRFDLSAEVDFRIGVSLISNLQYRF